MSMSDLFEEDDPEVAEQESFDSVEVNSVNVADSLMDARRRLEKVLDEKRLKEELEDFDAY